MLRAHKWAITHERTNERTHKVSKVNAHTHTNIAALCPRPATCANDSSSSHTHTHAGRHLCPCAKLCGSFFSLSLYFFHSCGREICALTYTARFEGAAGLGCWSNVVVVVGVTRLIGRARKFRTFQGGESQKFLSAMKKEKKSRARAINNAK